MPKTYIFLIALCFLITGCSVNTDPETSSLDLASIDLNMLNENNWDLSHAILSQINNHRSTLEKPALVLDSLYASAYALQHTQYMMATTTVNHHHFFTRSEALKQQGATNVSETVAYGYHSAASVVNAWLNSPEHKNILEGNFSHLGFGVQKLETNNQLYFTLLFYK